MVKFKGVFVSVVSIIFICSFALIVSGCSYVQDVKTIDLKEKYFQNEESDLGNHVRRMAENPKRNVVVEYIDEGAIDVHALREKYSTENIEINSTSTMVDTLTTEVVEAFYGSMNDSAKDHVKFTVNNDSIVNLESEINRAMVNYDETGDVTILLMTYTVDRDDIDNPEMNKLNELVKEAKNHGTFLVLSSNVGGNLIYDYKYTCLDEALTINSCNYDGSARGNENRGDEHAHIDFALPSDHTYTSAALFASIVSQVSLSIDDPSTIESNLTSYILSNGAGEEITGHGVLSQRKLA